MIKKNIVTMILGTISGILFALGMCMAMLPAWHAMTPGIILGTLGLVGGAIMVLTRRKMAGKPLLVFNAKIVLTTVLGLIAILVFGTGMVLSLFGDMLIVGIVVGIVGIGLMLGLIPLLKSSAK